MKEKNKQNDSDDEDIPDDTDDPDDLTEYENWKIRWHRSISRRRW